MARPLNAAISLGALRHNLALARELARPARAWAVVKANAYGHGLLRTVRGLSAAEGYALLDFADALSLREAGIAKPILMLEGFFGPEDVPLLARHGLTTVIHSREQIAMLEAARLERPIGVYLKVNSGMNRLGFVRGEVRAAWDALKRHPQVGAVTLMTHFADADGERGVAEQLGAFGELTGGLQAPRSLANSAALLRFAGETRGDWVRPGVMLYGCSPFSSRSAAEIGLKPAMTLASEVIGVQQLRAGEGVGYGRTFAAERAMRIGIVACGYADGYPRHAPTGTPVLVAGQRTVTLGRVSMDMLCVDLSGLPAAGVGAPVTLWGEGLSADEVAAAAGTVSYQLLCGLAPRVPVREVA